MKLTEEFMCRAPYCAAPVRTQWAVCDLCWDYRDHWIEPLPDLWVRAKALLAPMPRSAMDKQPAAREPDTSWPIRTGPLMAMEYALVRLDMWAATLIRHGAPATVPARGTAREQFIFDKAWEVNRTFGARLLSTELGGDWYVDMYRAYWRLFKVDRSRVSRHLPTACPGCRLRTLVTRFMGECVVCLTCSTVWSRPALDHYGKGVDYVGLRPPAASSVADLESGR